MKIELIESHDVVDESDVSCVYDRPLLRRLLSGRFTDIRYTVTPSPSLFQLRPGVFVGHPETVRRVRRQMLSEMRSGDGQVLRSLGL